MIWAAVDVTDNAAATVWVRDNDALDLDPDDWGTGLRSWLREKTLHDAGEVAEALVRGLDADLHPSPGELIKLAVDRYGGARATGASLTQWEALTAPPAPPSVTEPETTEPQTTPAGHDSAEKTETPQPDHGPTVPAPIAAPAGPARFSLALPPDDHESEAGPPARAQIERLPEEIIGVVNLKGGVGKTTLAVTITQALADLAGHNDLALVEVNPAGTIRSRTKVTAHGDLETLIDRAIKDPDFGRSPRDLDDLLTWQPMPWAVLPSSATNRRDDGTYLPALTAQTTSLALDTLLKTCRTIVVDTGNDPRDAGWQEVIRRADRLLIPVAWEPDVMRSATIMIDDLRHDLSVPEIRQKVILVQTRPPFRRPSSRHAHQYQDSLTQAGLHVESLPPDRHLDQHGLIEWSRLASRTRAAATHIAEEIIAS